MLMKSNNTFYTMKYKLYMGIAKIKYKLRQKITTETESLEKCADKGDFTIRLNKI